MSLKHIFRALLTSDQPVSAPFARMRRGLQASRLSIRPHTTPVAQSLLSVMAGMRYGCHPHSPGKHLLLRLTALCAVLLSIGVVACGHARLTGRGDTTRTAESGQPHRHRPDWQTFVLLGLDQRTRETPRSDTIIVVSWDKANGKANVLSLPRDLWVQVPGFGWNKLSSAYTLGAGSDGPGGAELVRRTLRANLGIAAGHQAAVSLQGFTSIVDRLGGVWVDVPAPLVDNEYPDQRDAYRRVYIPAGLQFMDGATALQYVRSRHADSDFGRSQRQQQVLSAIRDRVTTLDQASHIPRMVQQLQKDVETDLSTAEMLRLAPAAMRMKMAGVNTESLDMRFLEPTQTGSGMSILGPKGGDWRRLRAKVATILNQ